jgi:hypothetical protein
LQYKPVFDVIKIDPSVVADIETNRDCRQPAALSRGSAREHARCVIEAGNNALRGRSYAGALNDMKSRIHDPAAARVACDAIEDHVCRFPSHLAAVGLKWP